MVSSISSFDKQEGFKEFANVMTGSLAKRVITYPVFNTGNQVAAGTFIPLLKLPHESFAKKMVAYSGRAFKGLSSTICYAGIKEFISINSIKKVKTIANTEAEKRVYEATTGCAIDILTQPISKMNMLIKTHKRNSLFQTFKHDFTPIKDIIKLGPASLLKGAVWWGAYSGFNYATSDLNTTKRNKFFIGFTGGFVAAATSYPIERTRIAVISSANESTATVLKKILTENGVKGLYSGFTRCGIGMAISGIFIKLLTD